MLVPATCPVCGAVGAAPCAACVAALSAAGPLAPPAGLDSCRAALRYEGSARQVVIALKYRNARRVLAWAAEELAGRAPNRVDLVTWPPTTRPRRRDRGFDQAELLARGVARRLRVPARRTLRRKGTAHQTGRSRAGRLAAPAFVGVRATPGVVLVVDDVVTTGATLSAAAAALRDRGADTVHALALAVRPAPAAEVRTSVPGQ